MTAHAHRARTRPGLADLVPGALRVLLLVSWLAAGLAGACAHAGEAAPSDAPPAAPEAEEVLTWSAHASVMGYAVPEDDDYLQPTLLVDHGALHLEARHAYEAPRTGSLWIGYNLERGERLTLSLTPMVGAVFGDTAGVAPGYRLAIGYRRLELASEGEYVLDAHDEDSSFLYNWTELSVAACGWLRAGFAVQRTRAYRTDLDVQRGFLAGVSYRNVDLAAYVFNPDEDPTVVVGLGVSF